MLLTAGRIEDSDDLVNYVKHNIGKNRVHVFGADTRANLCMLKRIADVGRVAARCCGRVKAWKTVPSGCSAG